MTLALHVDQQRAEDGTIGASQAAAALGLDPYRPPIQLWRELSGLPSPPRSKALAEAAECGQLLEPIVRAKYALETKSLVLIPETSFVIGGWLRATPDGFAIRRTAGVGDTEVYRHVEHEPWVAKAVARGRGGLFQAKTGSAYTLDDWAEHAPPAYEIQERVEMAVTEMPWADIYALIGGQRWMGPYRIERDLQIEDRILTSLEAFMKLVRAGVEPDVDSSDAWRAHVSEKMRKLQKRVTIDATPELMDDINAWREARQFAKRQEAHENELKNRLLLKLAAAGATAVKLPSGKPLTAYQIGSKPHWKEYALSLGGAERPPDQFRGTSSTWALRLPSDEPNESKGE